MPTAQTPSPPMTISKRLPLPHDWWDRYDVSAVDNVGVDPNEGRLVYRLFVGKPGEPRRRTVPARVNLLEDFIQLADHKSDVIEAFARRYGVLLLCERHNLPATHLMLDPGDAVEQKVSESVSYVGPSARHGFRDGCPLRQTGDGRWWEPIREWRRLSREARAVLFVGSALHEGRDGNLDDWKVLLDDDQLDPDRIPASLEARWWVVCEHINDWLTWGRVQLRVARGAEGPDVTIGGNSLFAALALELMGTVGRRGLATCYACGRPYFISRRPPAGRRNFCGDCGAKAASRYSKRDKYEQTRKERTAARSGRRRRR